MGLPSGLLWAPVNLDISQPGGYASSPFQYDCSYFSWGNTDGHNPTSPSSFSPWDWGGINDESPWYEGQIYGETPGAGLNDNISGAYDAASTILGSKWQIPSVDDWTELINNCDFVDANGNIVESEDKRVSVNGCIGLLLKSKNNGALLFFACCGYGVGQTLSQSANNGYYWSSNFVDDKVCRAVLINSTGVHESFSGYRYNGRPIRPVFRPSSA